MPGEPSQGGLWDGLVVFHILPWGGRTRRLRLLQRRGSKEDRHCPDPRKWLQLPPETRPKRRDLPRTENWGISEGYIARGHTRGKTS